MRTLAIANAKGGTGKTTTAVTQAEVIAGRLPAAAALTEARPGHAVAGDDAIPAGAQGGGERHPLARRAADAGWGAT